MTAVGWDDDCTGPCCRPPEPDLEELEAAWLHAHGQSHNAHTVELLTPLPAGTRLRLAVHRRIDRAGAWLCGHHCTWLAAAMWRACRMW